MADHSDEKHTDKKTDKHATDESPGPSSDSNPLVSVVMGSRSDWETMKYTHSMLTEFGIPHETMVVSAHRTPQWMTAFAHEAAQRGVEVIIAGAGGAAHLPGMIAAQTSLPVLGVPVQSKALRGIDSLLSIVQMPSGVAVGTLAIGKAGAYNAAVLATSILGNKYPEYRARLDAFRQQQTDKVFSERFFH
ncbi:MAG: 5-(carboxyamino)imidazole ribonucleotide mutase [Cyanobacteria bacterium HKST-UBA04]|nr:5-(carboxyamino)imidazole ribonucleotide mutase [Cyanobacteria bacterium HKST-UBA04]